MRRDQILARFATWAQQGHGLFILRGHSGVGKRFFCDSLATQFARGDIKTYRRDSEEGDGKEGDGKEENGKGGDGKEGEGDGAWKRRVHYVETCKHTRVPWARWTELELKLQHIYKEAEREVQVVVCKNWDDMSVIHSVIQTYMTGYGDMETAGGDMETAGGDMETSWRDRRRRVIWMLACSLETVVAPGAMSMRTLNVILDQKDSINIFWDMLQENGISLEMETALKKTETALKETETAVGETGDGDRRRRVVSKFVSVDALMDMDCAEMSRVARTIGLQAVYAKETAHGDMIGRHGDMIGRHGEDTRLQKARDMLQVQWRHDTSMPILDDEGKIVIGVDSLIDRSHILPRVRSSMNDPNSTYTHLLLIGYGRTTASARLCESLDRPHTVVTSADLMTALLGATERRLEALARTIRSCPQLVVIFDDIDQWLPHDNCSTSQTKPLIISTLRGDGVSVSPDFMSPPPVSVSPSPISVSRLGVSALATVTIDLGDGDNIPFLRRFARCLRGRTRNLDEIVDFVSQKGAFVGTSKLNPELCVKEAGLAAIVRETARDGNETAGDMKETAGDCKETARDVTITLEDVMEVVNKYRGNV